MQLMAYWKIMLTIRHRREREYWWKYGWHIQEWLTDLMICIVQLDFYDHFSAHQMRWSVYKEFFKSVFKEIKLTCHIAKKMSSAVRISARI
jgi:hypothetical protein